MEMMDPAALSVLLSGEERTFLVVVIMTVVVTVLVR
jgi:hypothetical protein